MAPLKHKIRLSYIAMAGLAAMGISLIVTCSKPSGEAGEDEPDGHRLKRVRKNEEVRFVAQIYGGDDVEPGSSLYVAALGFVYKSPPVFEGFCGGALIHEDWVLTAAHCAGINGVVLGVADSTDFEDQDHLIRDVQFMCHKDYLPATQENDIALVKLPSSVTTISPIALVSDASWEASPPPIVLAGWGEGAKTTLLQEAEVSLYDLEECKNDYAKSPYRITTDAICTRSAKAGALDGDSGGPAVIERNGDRFLVGVMSLGAEKKGFPNKHTKVTSYLGWIREVINGNQALTKSCY